MVVHSDGHALRKDMESFISLHHVVVSKLPTHGDGSSRNLLVQKMHATANTRRRMLVAIDCQISFGQSAKPWGSCKVHAYSMADDAVLAAQRPMTCSVCSYCVRSLQQ